MLADIFAETRTLLLYAADSYLGREAVLENESAPRYVWEPGPVTFEAPSKVVRAVGGAALGGNGGPVERSTDGRATPK